VVFERFRPPVEPRGAAGRPGADAPDRLRQHGAGDALRLSLEHVQDERPADALTVEMAPVDAEVVEEGDVIGGVAVPAVLRGDRGAGLAAGVALIHRDHAEVRRPLGGGVDRRGGLAPHLDHRLQARGREGEDGEALAELLVSRCERRGGQSSACRYPFAWWGTLSNRSCPGNNRARPPPPAACARRGQMTFRSLKS